MNKKSIFLLFFLFFLQVFLHAMSKEEYLKEFQELDNSSPEHACLEEDSFESCKDLMYEFGKPIYLNKIRAIVDKSNDVNILESYLHLEKKLPVRARNFKMTKKVIERLRSMGTKDALFVAYKADGNLDDLEKLANKIGDSGKTGKHELMREYYIRKVQNLNQLPAFLEKFNGYDTKHFREKALNFSEFGKNLTIDNFFNSIEYKYLLKELGYTLKYRGSGQQYDIILSPNGGGKPIVFTFNAKCHFSKNITRREDVGFFEGMGSGGATQKDVSYSVNECSALQSQDKSKIYKLYASTNQLSAYNELKNATWDYRVKTGQTYVANKTTSSKGKNYCFSSDIKSDRDRNICLASATKESNYCYGSGLSDRDRQMCLASATGQENYCFSSDIKSDRDRQMCLASATKKDSYCFSSYIKSDRDRNMCLASATGQESYCFSSGLSDRDRQMCLAQTK